MEPECDEQREARECLAAMEKETKSLKAMQERGEAPRPEDFPEQAAIEATVAGQMQWLRREAGRPASRRLPKDEAPPREVLSCAMNVIVCDRAPPLEAGSPTSGYQLQVVRYLEHRRGNMGIGFSVTATSGGRVGAAAQVACLPWKRGMGTWPAKNWAFLLAAIIKRFGWHPLHGFTASYKLQDVPKDDFEERVHECYVDIVRGNRYKGIGSGVLELSGLFRGSLVDVDRFNDLALCFDTRMWKVACELGLLVEDYSSRPALTFLVADSDVVVEGGTDRRRWDSVEAYIQSRLDSSEMRPSLNEQEAQKHKEFIWEVLQTQRMKEIKGNEGALDCWKLYSEYAERKLGKKLRRIARTFDMPIPSLATEHVRLRCDYCNKPEGEVVGDDGTPGAKLSHCPCNPDGHPYYCGSECQALDFPSHKEFCTYAESKKKDKKKKSPKKEKKSRTKKR